MGRSEVTIAGVGGQGSILAGMILGAAAVTHEGRYAVQTQAYSSELRGGYAAAWVIISDEPVVFPRVLRPDILVAQAPDSLTRFFPFLKPEGILLVDSDMIPSIPEHAGPVWAVPATSIARNRIKAAVTANMVMLGALCRTTNIVERAPLEEAIKEAVPEGKEGMNLEAFGRGFEGVRKR